LRSFSRTQRRQADNIRNREDITGMESPKEAGTVRVTYDAV
jgi:hypothetical protein